MLLKRGWRTALGLRVGVFTLGSSLALAAVEGALRLTGSGSDQLLRADPALGVRFIPSKSGLNQDSCYRAHVRVNDQGWRSRMVSPDKPADVYRVLVLGDSFMAALQVDEQWMFARALEREVNARNPGRQVEVVNFAVPSWGTDQEYLALREQGRALKPDLVVLAFYGQNDVSDNAKAINSTASSYPKPYFALKDGQLVGPRFKDPTPAIIRWSRQLAGHFRLYPLVRDALVEVPFTHTLLYRLGIVGIVPSASADQASPADGSWGWPDRWKRQTGVYAQDYSREWIEAWALTEALVEASADEAHTNGADLLLVQIADPLTVMPPEVGRRGFGERWDSFDLEKPGRLLRSITEKRRIEYVSLVPTFRERIGDSEEAFAKYYLPCDGHWTPAGHQLAAEAVASAVVARVAGGSALPKLGP